MDNKEIIQIYGLSEDASEEDVRTALKAGAQAIGDLAAERARAESSEDDAKSAKDDKEKLEVELENEKKAHKATADALANEKAVRADAAIDAAVREKRIGESARETWKTRLVNEGAPAYAALANEKPLPTRDATQGLANECGDQTDSEKRKAMVNEIMTSEKVDYDTAWQRAARRSPELFK
jgi:hypothetical protein